MASRVNGIFFVLAFASSVALTVGSASWSAAETDARANPIRRVVTLLQNMQKKITAEGAKELTLFEKFECYCKTSGGDLTASISAAEAKVPEVGSAISETEAKVTQLEEDVKQAQIDRTAAKEAIASAKAIREKAAAAFSKDEAELSTNIAALSKAISALKSGMVGAFVQSSSAQALRRVIVDRVDMTDFDREMVASFLGEGSHQGYAPQSGQIVGILEQLKETMSKDLQSATSSEEASIKSHDELMAAKTKEIAVLTKAIEVKTERIGEAKVEVVQMKQDLSDTEKALLDDKAFLAGLDKNCADKKAEHEENTKVRSQELLAIADTIKVLNDDDALDLFKKTLPGASSASFVQMQVRSRATSQRQRALKLLQAVRAVDRARRPGLDFIVMAMKGGKMSFDKVIKMIDDMVALLAKEQTDDEHKKEMCEVTLDQQDDKMKELGQTVADLEVNIAHEEELIATLADELKALEAGVVALDKSVADATEQRKEEHATFVELVTSDQAAKELLEFAKNRLNKFYNPALYKAPPKRVLSEEDKIYTTFGGELAPTPAPGGIAGTGVSAPSLVQVVAHQQRSVSDVAPPPPPATAAAYKKMSGESTGVIYMIDTLIKDLDKEMTEAETAEKEAQADYETAMAESATKRAQDTKTITDKEGAKADISTDLLKHKEEKTATGKSLMATSKVIADTHSECDWLLQNFEVRKEARSGEVDSLKQAKAVLSGADFSFVQKASAARSLRGHM